MGFALEIEVKFEGERPTLDEILSRVREISGVEIEVSGILFCFNEFNGIVEYYFPKDSSSIFISVFTLKDFYLKCVVLAALIDLGGIYDKENELPYYSRVKWAACKKDKTIPR